PPICSSLMKLRHPIDGFTPAGKAPPTTLVRRGVCRSRPPPRPLGEAGTGGVPPWVKEKEAAEPTRGGLQYELHYRTDQRMLTVRTPAFPKENRLEAPQVQNPYIRIDEHRPKVITALHAHLAAIPRRGHQNPIHCRQRLKSHCDSQTKSPHSKPGRNCLRWYHAVDDRPIFHVCGRLRTRQRVSRVGCRRRSPVHQTRQRKDHCGLPG